MPRRLAALLALGLALPAAAQELTIGFGSDSGCDRRAEPAGRQVRLTARLAGSGG